MREGETVTVRGKQESKRDEGACWPVLKYVEDG